MAAAFADDEYMLGPDLLVAPVIDTGVTSREVHLPPGAWASFWTNAVMVGPTETTAPAPLGTPIVYGRVGSLIPMLAADIDTLIDANAGAVISASQRPTVEARGWPSGSATASFDDGTTIAIMDTAQGVGVTSNPDAFAQAVVFTLDLSSRTGTTTPLTHVVVGGSDIPALATEADVRAATGNAYVLSGNSIVLRLAGAVTAWIE